jgi:uncharacterized protein YceH (UPF0502 family)
MAETLNPNEARVIGCLIEKEITTPEQYPLSLNALMLACNQKSNRDPVMQLDESAVQAIVDGLVKRHLVSEKSGFGSRVAKYKHRFCNNEFGGLQFSAQEVAVICVLLLRGPQTPGELRTRTNRLCSFAGVAETEAVLEQLLSHPGGPFVARLPREPGRRESRYAHLFGSDAETVIEQAEATPSPSAPRAGSELTQRVEELETLVLELREEVDRLKQRLDG